MSSAGPWLTCLALATGALFALGLVGTVAKPRSLYWAILTLCLTLPLLAAGFLVTGAEPVTLVVPVGLPGAGVMLALDGVSAFFLLPLGLIGAAAAGSALDDHSHYDATAPLLPVFIGAMALTLLASDAFSLVLGFEAMSLASFGLVLTNHAEPPVRGAALLYMGMAMLGGACLIPAMALLAHVSALGVDLSFPALRADPPEGWRAVAVLALALIGAGSKAGLAPLHVWLPPAHAAAPAHVSALMSGAMTKVALYVLLRVVFDLCGPAQPIWWGVPLIAMGAMGAVLGALRANVEGDIKAVLACSTVDNVGLIAVGIGLALAARGADLPALAALALGGALLHAFGHALFKSLLFLGAGSALHGGGTRIMARLGGLVGRMPLTTAAMLVGGASLAGLPPSVGFAGEWTLFQAILAGPRIGGVALQTLICVAGLLMALAAALAAAAAVRMIGVAFLGRPRTPRAAAAQEAGFPAQFAMLGLGLFVLLLGLFPALPLHLARSALLRLVGQGMQDRAGWLGVSAQADAPGYAAPGIALLLIWLIAATFWALRLRGAPAARRAPAWDCGFGAPPPWLPFGDPITQYGAASFGQPLRRALGRAILSARESVAMPAPGDTAPAKLLVSGRDPAEVLLFHPAIRARFALSAAADRLQFLTIRRTLSLIFAVLVLFLIVIALAEQL